MNFFKKKKVERPQTKNVCTEPLTLSELDTQIKKRIDLIQEEFTSAFNMIKCCDKTVSFFGSARALPSETDYMNSYKLGAEIAKLGYGVVTGGGPGIMEAANKGAFENDGLSMGFTIKLPTEQATNPYLTKSLEFRYFFTRKVALTYAAEAYVYFPGGFGTLDELFEILTLVQTTKIEVVPIILFGSEFWNPLRKFIVEYQLENHKISSSDLDLFVITDSIEEVVEIIKAAPIRSAH